jgi:hypothetical protein
MSALHQPGKLLILQQHLPALLQFKAKRRITCADELMIAISTVTVRCKFTGASKYLSHSEASASVFQLRAEPCQTHGAANFLYDRSVQPTTLIALR